MRPKIPCPAVLQPTLHGMKHETERNKHTHHLAEYRRLTFVEGPGRLTDLTWAHVYYEVRFDVA